MYIAIRLRGHAGTNQDTDETMDFLGLKAPNNCVVVEENAVMKGMLHKAKDYIAWGEADEKTVKQLRAIAKDKDGKIIIRFSPPSKGFKNLKEHYPKGALGYYGKKINDFVQIFI